VISLAGVGSGSKLSQQGAAGKASGVSVAELSLHLGENPK